MEIFAYGEDALTLWALQNKLDEILATLGDASDPSECQAFFRPSFGRRGGASSAQFGEFDFILLTRTTIYLGESKWDGSSEQILEGVLQLKGEQQLRHTIFRIYVKGWAYGNHPTWQDFEKVAQSKLQAQGITKPIAPENSLLARNIRALLDIIKRRYDAFHPPQDVLLFLHRGATLAAIPSGAGKEFAVVALDYSEGVSETFIKLA